MIINGGPGDETLTGTSSDDVIDGRGGADTMIGLAGNDRYYVDNAGDQITEATGQGADHAYSAVDYILAAGQEIESLRVYGVATGLALTGNGFGNYLVGGVGSDTLNGEGGEDELNGAAGADIMAGGIGNDRYYVDNAGDQIAEAIGQGTDHIYSTVDYTLAAGQEIESLRVYGVATGLTLTGNGFGNYLVGGAGSDTLNGAGGDDELNGAAGTDVLAGGIGNDRYYVDNAGDQVIEAAGQGTDHVYSTVDYTLAAGQEIESLRVYGVATGLTLTGNGFGNYLVGGAGDDALNGEGGDDELNGAAGADIMAGGTGNDKYYVDNAGDQIAEATGQGTDHIYSTVDYTLVAGQEIESLRVYGVATGLTLTGNEFGNYLVGGAGSDTLTGAGGNDELNGAAGADVLAGGIGNDRYYVDNAADQVVEAAGGGSDNVYASVDYTLAAGQEVEALRVYGSASLALTGNELANSLIGGAGNDTLNGGGGGDTMAGGSGDDSYTVDDAGDQVIEAASGGSDTVHANVDYTLAAGQEVEFLRNDGSVGLALTGNEFSNALFGGAGDDTLDGGIGADMMAGGRGNDSYTVDTAGDQVIEAAGGGSDTIHTSVNYTLATGEEIESLRVEGENGLHLTGNDLGVELVGGIGADMLTGGAGDDVITSGAGFDVIDGGDGADIMNGGDGSSHGSDGDIFYVDNAGDQIVGGTIAAIVYVSADWTVSADVVGIVQAVGSTGLHLTGHNGHNRLVGGAGADTLTGGVISDILDGGAGADILIGGAGTDHYYVDNTDDQVIDSDGVFDAVYASGDYALAADQKIEYMQADGPAGLRLTGNDFGMQLFGGAGSDTLTGGAGDDTIMGGPFDASDTMNGGAGDDVITGGAGADIIDGGAGADVMDGGGGANDTFHVDNAGDQIIGFAPNPIIYTSVDYTLGDNLLGATLYAVGSTGLHLTNNNSNSRLVGGAGNDTLTGGGFVNSLDGGAGADVMIGGIDADYYYVDNTGDQVIEAPSDNIIGKFDTIYTSIDYTLAADQEVEYLRVNAENGLHLTANDLGVQMFGGDGDDTLTGGADNDVLTGGAGVDTFVFSSQLGNGNIDTVADFNGANEIVRLDHTHFAGLMGALTAAQFSLNTPTGVAPQIVYDTASGVLSYASGGTQLQFAVMANHATLSASNFVAF